MIQQFNAVHAALNEEINDIRESISLSETNNSRANYLYQDGSVVLPISNASSLELVARDEIEWGAKTEWDSLIGGEHSIVQDRDIIKIQNANKKLLATYANMMIQPENTGRYYGMLVIDGEKKINPLHPVIAAMIVAGEIKLSSSFTIIVYPYESSVSIDREHSKENQEDIVRMILSIRASQYIPSIVHAPSNSLSNDIEMMVRNIDGMSVHFRESGSPIKEAVIPVQLATNSIVYPYYGLISSIGGAGGAYMSRNLYPCLSGNIDTRDYMSGNTCVGNLSNYTFTSLYVLANMNINSMYFGEIITNKTTDFVDACQNVSAEFLSAYAGIVFNNGESDEDTSPEQEHESETTESCETCES